MRILVGAIAAFALALIVGSAVTVLSKEDAPRLAVDVKGVPGYIYYDRAYDLTIEYANHGGAVSGPVELSVQLPPTFALAEHLDDPTRHGERLAWQLDGLDSGELGAVTISVRGTLPEDLTAAVYDLPGYEGHTAFVEGFELDATLTAEGASADTLAVADTGAPPPGSVIVHKECLPEDADGQFSMTLLDEEEDEVETLNTICGGTLGFDGHPTGTYSVVEEVVAGDFVEVSNDCDSLEIVEGEQSDECTIVNEEAGTGSITVIKDTNPETSDIEFDFDSDFGDFDLEDDDSILFDDLDEDTYTISENPPAGWQLVEIDCGDADYSVNLNTETVEIDLDEGEDVTCTFINEPDDQGTIIIEKDVDPEPDGTDFSFSDNIPNCAIGVLDDDGGGATPNAVSCTDVPSGNYQVSESVPAGYELFHIDCDDPDGGTTVSGATAFIDLEDGETVHCTFHNRPVTQAASVTIVKDTNPETINVAFDFDSAQFGDFDLVDNGAKVFTNLSAGAYTVTENPPSGWAVLDILCNSSGVVESGRTVVIALDPGEHVTCTFINVQTTAPAAPTPTKAPAAPTATSVPIAAPSAGDGGLADPSSGDGVRWGVLLLAGLAGAATIGGYVRMILRRG